MPGPPTPKGGKIRPCASPVAIDKKDLLYARGIAKVSQRPEILFPLFAPITVLPGVGDRLAKLFEKLCGGRVIDLCWHLPSGLIDRSYRPNLAQAEAGRIATLTLTIGRHQPPRRHGLPYRIPAWDESGEIELVFFHVRGDYLQKTLPEGDTRIVSGKLESYRGQLQMSHPDFIAPVDEAKNLPSQEPVYPLTQGLSLKVVGKAVRNALKKAPELPEWLDPELRRRNDWPLWHEALQQAHRPKTLDDLLSLSGSRQRLAYDELLANQLALALMRSHQSRVKGRTIEGDGRLRRMALEKLPFRLTKAQERVLAEILADMAAPRRMLRLLQGDVGSGKTVVALLAMLAAAEAGSQAAIMAPTEILARQHLKTIEPIATALGIGIELLLGSSKGKVRDEALARLASGQSLFAVGTHALFQKGVEFKDLALAVIDEQHRFGVHQRLSLTSKGRGTDVLVMTATPIPRTLVLTSYGDMEVSRLDEKPAGRKEIVTRALSLDRLSEVLQGLERQLAQGAKIYWVCPLVEESEASDLAAVEARHRELKSRFGDVVGLIHGRLKTAEKDQAMASFAAGTHRLLVATTVIEVGMDVPDATVMIVEHADRFGLAQLHQLRGRIGRGEQTSSCLLLYQGPLGETAHARLRIMRESDDGFRIAEEDLRLRGAGELLGTRQSGFPVFHLADLAIHGELLAMARDDSALILHKDPKLETPRGLALRHLLYLFERDAAIRYLRSG
jgi:ATP-dependent DNA helicase RecG